MVLFYFYTEYQYMNKQFCLFMNSKFLTIAMPRIGFLFLKEANLFWYLLSLSTEIKGPDQLLNLIKRAS